MKEYIVDGQQRLTTITILLCVLRDTLASLGFEDLAKGIHGIVERPNIDNQLEFILTTESSFPYFQDHIQKIGEPDVSVTLLKEESNLKNAFDNLKSLVSSAVKSVATDSTLSKTKQNELSRKKIVGIRDSLLDLKLINIKLENEDDAYLIFETLNTRGKDLSVSDLVKSHFMKHLQTKSASIDQAKVNYHGL